MIFKEIDGDIFEYIDTGEYDVIIHGCNCFSKQKSGIAYPISKKFYTDQYYMERNNHPLNIDEKSRYNKLGCIEWENKYIDPILLGKTIAVANCYTQYHPGADARYNAIGMCFDKLNFIFKGKDLIMPQVGCGIGGLSIEIVKQLIHTKLKDLKTVTLINYKKLN